MLMAAPAEAVSHRVASTASDSAVLLGQNTEAVAAIPYGLLCSFGGGFR